MSMFTWREIPEDIHRKWKAVAALRGMSMASILEQALQNFLTQLEEKTSDRPNLGRDRDMDLDTEWDLDQDKLDAFNDPRED